MKRTKWMKNQIIIWLLGLFVFGRTINIHLSGKDRWMLLEWKWNNIRRFIYGIGQWNGRTVVHINCPLTTILYHFSHLPFQYKFHFNFKGKDAIWWYWRQCSCWNEVKWNGIGGIDMINEPWYDTSIWEGHYVK
jgi:hypothetical protein